MRSVPRQLIAVSAGMAILLLAGAGALAQDRGGDGKNKGDDGKTPDFKNLTDAQFAKLASAAGLAEVNLSQLAVNNAMRPDVKQFARQMIDDHGKANAQLMKILSAKSTPMAEKMDAKHEALSDTLSRLTGANFDREYLKAMLKDHEEAVALFGAASQNLTDNELKAFASKTLPTIKEHLEKARKLAGEQ